MRSHGFGLRGTDGVHKSHWLAQDASIGLAAYPDLFPSPPTSAEAISRAIAAYNVARDAAMGAWATALQNTALKKQALEQLTELLKGNLRYAESMTRADGAKLQLIGWGPRRTRTPAQIEVPGQVITLEVRQEGRSWVALGWRRPFEGGRVSAYRVQRRRREGGDWMDVGASVETAITLSDQENGVELEYRVIGLNKAGEGPPSNIARVVL